MGAYLLEDERDYCFREVTQIGCKSTFLPFTVCSFILVSMLNSPEKSNKNLTSRSVDAGNLLPIARCR